MALTFKEPLRRSPITEADSTHAPASALNVGDASDLEEAIGVHVVDQETLERDIALEVSTSLNNLGHHVHELILKPHEGIPCHK